MFVDKYFVYLINKPLRSHRRLLKGKLSLFQNLYCKYTRYFVNLHPNIVSEHKKSEHDALPAGMKKSLTAEAVKLFTAGQAFWWLLQ